MTTHEINQSGQVVPYTSGRQCVDTRAWRDATDLELAQRDEIAQLEKRVRELADLRDEAVDANIRQVKLVASMRRRIEAALNALWEVHGNGFGTPMESPIAELQTALDESA